MDHNCAAILILSCNRPERLEKLLENLRHNYMGKVYISVDKSRGTDSEKLLNEHKLIMKKGIGTNLLWIFRDQNYGIVKNLFESLDSILIDNEACVVLEDDIEVDFEPLKSLIERIQQPLQGSLMTIGLFGAIPYLPSRVLRKSNYWRTTKYFSAWCWAIRAESWNSFRLSTVSERWDAELLNSDSWKALGRISRKAWSYRFSKIQLNPLFAWDYQFQYYSFKNNMTHMLPVIRAADNVGFSDSRSTNTKSSRPKWYLGMRYPDPIISELRNGGVSTFLIFIDSLTWIGDHWFAQKFSNLKRSLQNRKK